MQPPLPPPHGKCKAYSPWNSRRSEELAVASAGKPLGSWTAVLLDLDFSFWDGEKKGMDVAGVPCGPTHSQESPPALYSQQNWAVEAARATKGHFASLRGTLGSLEKQSIRRKVYNTLRNPGGFHQVCHRSLLWTTRTWLSHHMYRK